MTKRLVLAGIAASMLYCSPLFAQAGISIEKIQPSVVDFYDEESELYGLMDGKKEVILEPAYEMIYPFYGGYAKVKNDEFAGLIDESGELVLPLEYDDILVSCYLPLSEGSEGTGYEAFEYFTVVKDGKVSFVKEGGDVACETGCLSEDADVKGASIAAKEDGKDLLIAADGTKTDLSAWEKCSCLNYSAGTLYLVEDENGMLGVIDWKGTEVLPCEYLGISLSFDGTTLTAKTDYAESVCYEVSYDLTDF